MRKRIPIGAAALGLLVTSLLPAARVGAVEVFDYCLDHPEQCAISVSHLTEGWERHLNADRLQSTASTFKILPLIVYAQAVVDGRIDPDATIPKEDWARFWVGRDGGALARSWEDLGEPDRVTPDQIMRKMIEESDNASPDWLLDQLGKGYFKSVLQKYVIGYHDLPESIGATFISWVGNPDEPAIGLRMLRDYSGIEALGYKKELGALFKRLADEDFTRDARGSSCSTPPWEAADPSCSPLVEDLAQSAVRRLAGGYFLRSNSRTYNRLLAGILDESLLPAAVQKIVVRHLEWQLEIPEASALATRLGTKGGSLAPQNVCNYVAYVELRDSGERLVVSVFLQDLPTNLACGDDIQSTELLEGRVLEEGFKQELMDRLPEEEPRPELIARLESLKRKTRAKGDQLKGRIRVSNIGPATAEGPFEVWLVASEDATIDRRDETLEKWVLPLLGAGGNKALRFNAKGLDPLAGNYLFVRVDRKKEVAESGEDNDRPWQILD